MSVNIQSIAESVYSLNDRYSASFSQNNPIPTSLIDNWKAELKLLNRLIRKIDKKRIARLEKDFSSEKEYDALLCKDFETACTKVAQSHQHLIKNLHQNKIKLQEIICSLKLYNKTFARYIKIEKRGYIQKIYVPKDAELFFIPDIHGNLETLLLILEDAVKKGYLDKNYKIPANAKVIFVFEGDNQDRGYGSLRVNQIIMHLRMQNTNNIILIRGNHETIYTSKKYFYQKEDSSSRFLYDFNPWNSENEQLKNLLDKFYSSLALAACFILPNQEDVIFASHGTFNPYEDLHPFLQNKKETLYWIDYPDGNQTNTFTISQRIQDLPNTISNNKTRKRAEQFLSIMNSHEIPPVYQNCSPERKGEATYNTTRYEAPFSFRLGCYFFRQTRSKRNFR